MSDDVMNLLFDTAQCPRSILLVGPSGSMKTISASFSPQPQLWISADPGPHGGLVPVWSTLQANQANFVLNARKTSYLRTLNFILANGHNYATIIIDSLTYYQHTLLDEIMSATKKVRPTFDEWGLLVERTRNILKAAIDSGAHTWINCLEQLDKDELTGTIIGLPHVFGKMAHDLAGMVRTALHIESRPRHKEEPDRYVFSVPSLTWKFCKDSEGILSPEEPHPEWVAKMFGLKPELPQ